MSEIENFVKSFEKALAAELTFNTVKYPLNNKRLIQTVKPKEWLKFQLGKVLLESCKLEIEDAGDHLVYETDDATKRQINKILGLIEQCDRTPGRPSKEKSVPLKVGRPNIRTDGYLELWLRKLAEAEQSEGYKIWLKENNERKSDKSKILYILEKIIEDELSESMGRVAKYKIKEEAKKRLRTHQNMISQAKKLSQK